MGLYTGFRKSNILGLKWSNIDYFAKQITVKVKDKTTEGGRLHTIPLTETMIKLLASLEHEGEYVFTYEGHRMRDIKTAWAATLRRAQVRHRSFHTIRHTTATWMLIAGVDVAVVSKLLGHKSITTTLRFYGRIIDDRKSEALTKTFG